MVGYSKYINSWNKRAFDIVGSCIAFLICLPVFMIVMFLVLTTEGWPILFTQYRAGKNGKKFKIYKFRTMRPGAEKEQSKLKYLNEVDGPVFKIKHDPRFIGIGSWLSNIGLDELPQIINVLKGEMSLIGPRPLPIPEAEQLSIQDRMREAVLPGIVSWWVIKGSHDLQFKQWMNLDRDYIQTASLKIDLAIMLLAIKQMVNRIRNSMLVPSGELWAYVILILLFYIGVR